MTTHQALSLMRLMRLPAVFTALSNILAAHLIATHGQIQWSILGITLVISACLYTGGMVMNDIFDLEEDARERPYRPLPSGSVSQKPAYLVLLILFTLAVTLSVFAGMLILSISAGLILLITTYNAGLKHTLIGPLAMGLCRSGNWLLGLSVDGLQTMDLYLILPIGLYVITISTLSRDETSARTRNHIFFASMIFITGVIVTLLITTFTLEHHGAGLLVVIGSLMVLRRMASTKKDYHPKQIQDTIHCLLLGIIPLDATLALAGGPWWGGILVLGLWYPSRWMTKHMTIT